MEHRMLQVIAGQTGLQAGELARDRIRGLFLSGRSQALDESSRREMEALTGYDLSAARIHSSFPAGSLAQSIGAKAFTIGSHIFAPPGKLDTTLSEGRGLLAHELTHVIQQTAPRRSAGDGTAGPQWNERGAELPLVQAAGNTQDDTGSDTSQRRMETEAVRREAAARTAGARRSRPPEIDRDQLADMVYRLMQNELQLHLDRRR